MQLRRGEVVESSRPILHLGSVLLSEASWWWRAPEEEPGGGSNEYLVLVGGVREKREEESCEPSNKNLFLEARGTVGQ